MTSVQGTKSFSWDIHKPLSPSQIIRLSWPSRGYPPFRRHPNPEPYPPHLTFLKSAFVPQILPSRSRLPIMRSLPLRGPSRPEGPNSKIEALNKSPPDLCLLLRIIFSTLKTCNAPTLKRAVIHDSKFTGMQSRLMSLWSLNKSTCRSFNYNHLPIPPPRQHPCQAYKILLLLGEGNRSLS